MNQMQIILAQYMQTIADISARLADAALQNETIKAENVSLKQQIAEVSVKQDVTSDYPCVP